jgi:hypothetical protein
VGKIKTMNCIIRDRPNPLPLIKPTAGLLRVARDQKKI